MSVILGIIGFVLALCAVLIVASGSLPMFICAPFVLMTNLGGGTWSTVLVALAVIAAGIISVFCADDIPCPVPQLIGSAIIAVVLTVVDLFVGQYEFQEAIGLAIMTPVLFTTMIFPMVTLVSAIAALPLRACGVYNHALINFFTMLSIAVVLESLAALLDASSFVEDLDVFRQYRYLFALHSGTKARAMAWLQAYTGIDVGTRLLVGIVAALGFGYAQLVREGEAELPSARRRHRRAYTPNATAYTPVAPRAAYATPTARTTVTAAAARPAASMNAADAAFLDALSAQVESGTPVSLNTKTGTTDVSRKRR